MQDGVGYGADVVLEMVGHNTETISMAVDLAQPGGTILAFGVPDEQHYIFPYKKWFRQVRNPSIQPPNK
jgi:L-iditol 2-dehydrogenase